MGTEQTDHWLGKVFGAAGGADQAANYDAWAATYDADIVSVGYLTPAVVTGALARFVPPDAGAVLDAGCGTGLAGEILATIGYARLTGIDMSEGMLARAALRGVYAELHNRVLGEQLGFADGHFAGCIISGVFNAGHAPAASLDELIRVVRPGGVLAFNVGEAAWTGSGYGAKLAALEAAGRWRRLFESRPYRSMPLSAADGHFTSQVFAYEVT